MRFLYGVIGMPLLACSVLILQVYAGEWCILFACAGVERECYSKTSEPGVDIC